MTERARSFSPIFGGVDPRPDEQRPIGNRISDSIVSFQGVLRDWETRSRVEQDDDAVVRALDRAWNDAYIRNDRTPFAEILADDFVARQWNCQTITKTQLMSGGEPASVAFSEFAIHLFGPTAITTGRIRFERARDSSASEQRFVRIYSKRDGRWQAVAVQVFPVG
jgi:ketosteroid isomerase-like protein